MKRVVFTLFVLILAKANIASYEPIQKLFDEGNRSYNKGEYEKAYNTYLSIVKQGYESSDFYFNMGNAAFKENKIPLSILNYERAKLLNPNDPDIDFNIKMANLKIIDKIDELPELFYKRWWKSIYTAMSPNQWSWIAVIFIFLGCVGLILFVISTSSFIKKIFFWTAIVLILIGFIAITSANSSYNNRYMNKAAIIFQPSVSIVSSPNNESTKLFVVHEGTKVSILESMNGWHKIMLADGHIGWLRSSDIEII